jgi:hypothetical protein
MSVKQEITTLPDRAENGTRINADERRSNCFICEIRANLRPKNCAGRIFPPNPEEPK